jgi:GNAT superfamily N-acetyltransferase
VLAEAHGRGIGRLLLRHALQRARERGATRLGLTTNERNAEARPYRSRLASGEALGGRPGDPLGGEAGT